MKLLSLCSGSGIEAITSSQWQGHSRLAEYRIRNGIPQIPLGATEWQYIIETARREWLSRILYGHLVVHQEKCASGANGNGLLPKKYMEELQAEYFLTLMRNKHYFRELVRCLKAMDVPVILLKGAALLPVVYKDLGKRPIGDFDILIKHKDLEQVKKRLRALGYESLGGHGQYANRISFQKLGEPVLQLEAHWHVENAMFPNFELFPLEKMWQSAIPVEIEDYEGLIFAPHHQLIHLTVHALKHSYDRLILLWDIHSVINHYGERLNWEELVRDATELHLSRPVFYGLYLTKLLLNTDVPEQVLNRLKPRSLCLEERAFVYFIKRGIRKPGLQYLVYFSMNRDGGKKLRFLWWALFPPRDIIAEMESLDDSKVGVIHWLKCTRRRFESAWRLIGASLRRGL